MSWDCGSVWLVPVNLGAESGVNREWFGDSYDIVKRFFIDALHALGYAVYVDPMPTGEWTSTEPNFLRFLRTQHVRDAVPSRDSALLLDPDTGISTAASSRRHASVATIVSHLKHHTIVFAFDQSFSRGLAPWPQIQHKLSRVHGVGAHAFYYDSHARFLFASYSSAKLWAFRETLIAIGLPAHRLVVVEEGTGKA